MSQPSLLASLASLAVGCALSLACTGIATANETPFDGGKPILCALAQVAECGSSEGCIAVTTDVIDAPPFLTVDARAKIVSGKRPGGEMVKTKILAQNKDGGELILQGVENARGWTLAVDQTSGRFTLSIAGWDLAFVGFGHCTIP